MEKSEMILALGNALIMINTVSAEGEKNWNALLATRQQVKKVYDALMKEAEHAAENE